MKTIKIRLFSKSPSSFLSSRAVSNVEETLDYIPGSVLRGSLAKEWLKKNQPDDNFKTIFTEDIVHFCNLYIDGALPLPLSAYSCKYYSGFMNERDTDNHGILDLLIPSLQSQNGPLPSKYQKCSFKIDGNDCNAPIKKTKGFYKIKNSNYTMPPISKRLIYHTAISPVSETALERGLYSLEVIDEGQFFEGEIIIHNDSLADSLVAFIKELNFIFIGSDKSRGLGQFEIKHTSLINHTEIEAKTIKERIDGFNKKLAIKNGKTYILLTLLSDAIITDKFMRYITHIDLSDVGIEKATFVNSFNNSRIISGWNAMSGIPKEDVIAISKGSVFVFCIDNLYDDYINNLLRLENEGIGKRRSVGFGRISVCDPFHWSGGELK